jgi:cysteine-rich repeat protein
MASITRWLVLAAIVAAGCAQPPAARECPTGITCPEGTKCAAAQAVCITNNCGDGIQQSTEKCDDGNITDGDGCAADCRSSEVCGDGVLNSAAGEVCDDSNTLGGDGCAADCRSVEVCGNSIRDVGEACDDGNTVPGDGCSGNCRSTEICGNGIVDVGEKCDDSGTPGGCNDDCQGGTGCGDGAIDKDGSGNPLEECDDGNTDNQDDCTNGCHLNHCGDGIEQTSGTHIEQCDPSVNFGETTDCNLDCTDASCGDGKINKARSEQCDDKNVVDEDACKNDCTVNYCGDGVDGGPNEACDDGADTSTCDSDCTFIGCGDGYVNLTNEQCDSGGVNTATCDANCTIPVCGDGTTNLLAGEQCDDMNGVNGDNCRNDCRFNVCGDNYVDLEAARVEACDDGNMMTELACPYGVQSCTICNDTCTMALARTGNVCGDNSVSSGNEMCDDGNRVTESSCPYGQPTCTNFCKADCSGTLSLTGLYCGDGTVTSGAGEACDDGNSMACGRCDAGCNMFASAAATGYIVSSTGQQVSDNDTFTINDGFGTIAVFEFDKNASGPTDASMTNIVITTSNSETADQLHTKIRTAIDGTPSLRINATDGGNNLVLLTHERKSSLGNQLITDTVNSSDFVVSGMVGGAGGDCTAGIGCTSNDDCRSGSCGSNNQCN